MVRRCGEDERTCVRIERRNQVRRNASVKIKTKMASLPGSSGSTGITLAGFIHPSRQGAPPVDVLRLRALLQLEACCVGVPRALHTRHMGPRACVVEVVSVSSIGRVFPCKFRLTFFLNSFIWEEISAFSKIRTDVLEKGEVKDTIKKKLSHAAPLSSPFILTAMLG